MAAYPCGGDSKRIEGAEVWGGELLSKGPLQFQNPLGFSKVWAPLCAIPGHLLQSSSHGGCMNLEKVPHWGPQGLLSSDKHMSSNTHVEFSTVTALI